MSSWKASLLIRPTDHHLFIILFYSVSDFIQANDPRKNFPISDPQKAITIAKKIKKAYTLTPNERAQLECASHPLENLTVLVQRKRQVTHIAAKKVFLCFHTYIPLIVLGELLVSSVSRPFRTASFSYCFLLVFSSFSPELLRSSNFLNRDVAYALHRCLQMIKIYCILSLVVIPFSVFFVFCFSF